MRDNPVYLVPFEFEQLIAPAAWLLGTFLAGYLIYRIVFRRLKQAVTLTSWGADVILVAAARDGILMWFALAGAFGALRNLPLRRDVAAGIERTLMVVLVLSVTWVIARVAGDLLKLYVMRSGSLRGSSSILINLSRLVVFLIGILIILQVLGIPVAPLLGALGIGGIAIAFALQDVLASFFAGIQLLASKKIQPGDFIELGSGQAGWVMDINWRNTTIRALTNNDVIIPNSTLANEIVTNYNRPEQEMSIVVEVGVHYDSDLDHVEHVTIEVARDVLREVEEGVPEFEPFIRYEAFDDSRITLSAILRTRKFTDKYVLIHEFIKRLHRRYEDERIVIPYPIRTIELTEKAKAGATARAHTSGLRARTR